MASPKTTFEVKISNKLQATSIWVRINADRSDATQLSSSSHKHNTSNNYNQHQYSVADANSKYNNKEREAANYSNNKTHNKSTFATSSSNSASFSNSQSQSSSSSTNVSADASYGLFSANVDVSHNKSNQSSSHSSGSSSNASSLSKSNDNLKHNISAHSHKNIDESASTDYKSDAQNNISSKQNISTAKYSSNATLTNKIIDPGFVRITPLQSLAIPVIVDNESQVVYATIYCSNDQGERIVIANHLQTNRRLIEIRKNKITNDIEIASESEISGKYNSYRKLLLEWGLPEYLCDAMKQSGWDNPNLWDDITEQHLIKMGFKDGHRAKFNAEYINYKMMKQRIKNKLTYKDLLRKWGIPIHLYGNMKVNGWDDVSLWNDIDDDDLKEMDFKKGHIKKFRRFVNDKNDHLKEFEQMKRDLEQNKINTIIMYDEDDGDENNDHELKSEYDIPDVPIFEVKEETIYHNAFDVEFETIKKNEIYIVELKEEKSDIGWKIVAEVTQTKQHRLNDLKMNTRYMIRARAQNVFQKKSEYTDAVMVKTQDNKWRDEYVPNVPSFKYKVYKPISQQSSFIIVFDETEIQKMKETKFKQKYVIKYKLSQQDEKEREQENNWENQDGTNEWKMVGEIQKDKSKYELNLEQGIIECKHLLLKIDGINDSNIKCRSSEILSVSSTDIPTFDDMIFELKPIEIVNSVTIKNNNKTIKKIKDARCAPVTFGSVIKYAKKYTITWKYKRNPNVCGNQYYIGFTNKPSSIKSFLDVPGYGPNKNDTMGLHISSSIALYDKDMDDDKFLFGKFLEILDEFDGWEYKHKELQWRMEFNFNDSTMTLWWKKNNKSKWVELIKPIRHSYQHIIPIFSTGTEETEIEIIDWKISS